MEKYDGRFYCSCRHRRRVLFCDPIQGKKSKKRLLFLWLQVLRKKRPLPPEDRRRKIKKAGNIIVLGFLKTKNAAICGVFIVLAIMPCLRNQER